jgi:hypothetical protein
LRERSASFFNVEKGDSGGDRPDEKVLRSLLDVRPILLLKEIEMARKDGEYTARIQDDSGTVRGKIPSPLVREMGARPGDYMIFRIDETGNVTVSLSRTRGRKLARSAAQRSSNNGARATRGRPRKDALGKRR